MYIHSYIRLIDLQIWLLFSQGECPCPALFWLRKLPLGRATTTPLPASVHLAIIKTDRNISPLLELSSKPVSEKAIFLPNANVAYESAVLIPRPLFELRTLCVCCVVGTAEGGIRL